MTSVLHIFPKGFELCRCVLSVSVYWIVWYMNMNYSTWYHLFQQRIQGGCRGGHAPPPSPVKTSHKKDGRQRRPHRFQVSWPPPYPAAGSSTAVVYNETCTKDSPSYTTDINVLPFLHQRYKLSSFHQWYFLHHRYQWYPPTHYNDFHF